MKKLNRTEIAKKLGVNKKVGQSAWSAVDHESKTVVLFAWEHLTHYINGMHVLVLADSWYKPNTAFNSTKQAIMDAMSIEYKFYVVLQEAVMQNGEYIPKIKRVLPTAWEGELVPGGGEIWFVADKRTPL